MKLHLRPATILTTLLISIASLAEAASTPVDITWAFPSDTPFTFDNVILTPRAQMDAFGNGPYFFTESGTLELSVFLNDGIPTAVPSAAYPAGVFPDTPYSLFIDFHGFGSLSSAVFPGAQGDLSFTTTMLMLGRWCPECGVQLNPLASADGLDLQFEVRTRGTMAVSSGSGGLRLTEQFTLPFNPWDRPYITPYWVSPPLSAGQPVIELTLSGPIERLSETGFHASFDSGNLIFLSPVPEPDRNVMLVLGLGAILLVANRRKRKNSSVSLLQR